MIAESVELKVQSPQVIIGDLAWCLQKGDNTV